MPQPSDLIGRWEKASRDPCANPYPETITFLANGTYRGTPAAPGEYTVWDVGTYRLATPTTLEISTANDAVIAYPFTLTATRLTLTSQDCHLAYQRAAP